MSLTMDRSAVDAMVRVHVRQAAEQAKPVLERRINGAFALGLEDEPGGGIALSSGDPKALIQEYGTGEQPGQPWAMQGLMDFAGASRGNHT